MQRVFFISWRQLWPFFIILALAEFNYGAQDCCAQDAPTMKRTISYIALGGGFSYYQLDYGQRDLGGAMAYIDLNINSKFGLEGEERWLNLNQNYNVNATTLLGGLRYTLIHPYGLAPYVKFLVGSARFNFPYNYATGKYFVIAPGGGVDWSLTRSLRIRIVDVEYQDWPGFTYGAVHSVGVSTGVSVNFPRTRDLNIE